MEKLPDRILALIQASPGLTDRQIADALVGKGAPQQQVNQTCNRLTARGLLVRRHRAGGKIGNYPAIAAAHAARSTTPGLNGPRPVENQAPSQPGLHWSAEILLQEEVIEGSVPHSAGVYQLFQNVEYRRYEGSTRVLKIGCSESDLCAEVLNHFQRHAVANRLLRVRARSAIVVTVTFAKTTAAFARVEERELLKAFEDSHWDLPVLNSQRGYERGGDAHFRPAVARASGRGA
jgi:hypothetical protein